LQTGTKISAVAHVALIGVALLGGAFRSDPLPFEAREVSVVTTDQFAALLAAQQSPQAVSETLAPVPPEPEADAPDIASATAEPEIDQAAPETAPAPETETTPDQLPDPLPPEPEAEISETAPVLPQPDEQFAALPPQPVSRPQPRPVERVAPVPVLAPPPDSAPDEVVRPEVAPEVGAEAPQPEQDATAPEEATDQIVPDAQDSTELAPTSSPRPPVRRPSAPAPTAVAVDTPRVQDSVQAALEEALGSAPAAVPVPTGPPLTQGEKESLRVAVSKCWNVGSLSSAALATTVIVSVSMTEDGAPVTSSIRLIGSSGGTDASAQQAFAAARRAIIRCGASGYDLPADKYGQWREIEMTFNPERMRIR